MIYFEFLIALLLSVSLAFIDKASSNHLDQNNAVLSFSFSKTFVCAVFAIVLLPFYSLHIDLAGILIALLAGICHAASVVLIMHSLKKAPAVYVNLLMSAGIILPSLFGWAFLGQTATVLKVISLFLLIGALALVLNFKRSGHFPAKLLVPMFFCYGLLLLMQGIFPHYCDGGSKTMFSAVMYSFSAVILFVILFIQRTAKLRLTKITGSLCASAAVLNVFINIILTDLSGKIAAAAVFPTVLGIKLVIITLLSPIFWKEKLSPIQIVGSILSVLCIWILSV